MLASESFEDFLGEEVVDCEGETVGTFACYWERDEGKPMWLGIDCDGDQKQTRVAPAKGARLNVKQTYISLPFTREKIEQAPCLDCDAELDAAFEDRLYAYFGMPAPHVPLSGAATARPELKRIPTPPAKALKPDSSQSRQDSSNGSPNAGGR